MHPLSHLFVLGPALFLPLAFACAGHELVEAKSEVSPFDPFEQGRWEFQIGAGAFFSIHNRSEERPTNNDAGISARLGWMLGTPEGDSCFRGNFELLAEASGGVVFEGPGDALGGLAVLLRRNFVQPGSPLVPYFQIGAGALLNDIHEDQRQRRIGQAFEFTLQAGLGIRYLFSEQCGAFVEGTYRHISNANLADRNFGMNSAGGLVGVNYFF